MNYKDEFLKRGFDIIFSFCGLFFLLIIILTAAILAYLDTGKNGFFLQTRVGKGGRLFKIIKIRTMRDIIGVGTTVTTESDPRITRIGAFFRRTKIDELPQLVNVLLGQMSFVGPRPDIPETYEHLSEEDKNILLSVRPGITGPATLKYRSEEKILASVNNPKEYNQEVIFPDKVRINRNYIENYSFVNDFWYIWVTIFGNSS